MLQHRRAVGQLKIRITRCLGYTSTDHAEFAEWLTDELSRGNTGDALFACGQCFRKPAHVAIPAERFLRALSRQHVGNRQAWLKPLAALLCYRSDATKEIGSDRCLDITKACLQQVIHELHRGNAQYIFRYAALVIVFMLRRRAYDNRYLDPDSELAGRIKDTFRQPIEAHRSGRLRVIGGAVDLPRALQQMIDYIDRRGMGSILLAAAED